MEGAVPVKPVKRKSSWRLREPDGTLLPKKKRDLKNLTVWHQDRTPLD